jgi:hypothetical protein
MVSCVADVAPRKHALVAQRGSDAQSAGGFVA